MTWMIKPDYADVTAISCHGFDGVYTNLVIEYNIPAYKIKIGNLFKRRLNYTLEKGIWNITIIKPTKDDQGLYECLFHPDGNVKAIPSYILLKCK